MDTEVLVIGAGASGLMAAYELVCAGKRVTVIEACNRTGGRMYTDSSTSFFHPVELGAEFVHGNLPVTLGLLQQAGISYYPVVGQTWQYRNGRFTQKDEMADEWHLLTDKMKSLQQDMSLRDFLNQYFAGKRFAAFRQAVCQFASGYDTSEPGRASVLALRNEWMHENEDAQYRITGGYAELTKYLVSEIESKGGIIFLNTAVSQINWQQGHVSAITATGNIFEAERVVLALPLGIWQAQAGIERAVQLKPAVTDTTNALKEMGFGAVIKVVIQFDDLFWESDAVAALTGQSLKNAAFIISDEVIPVWWTQTPLPIPLLTGWLGGPAAAAHVDSTEDQILQLALQSLAHIFKQSPEELNKHLVASRVANWTADPYTRGSYAYDTLATSASVALLSQPLADTVFFAGEFMYQGPAMGTVEAALVSGKMAADRILNLPNR